MATTVLDPDKIELTKVDDEYNAAFVNNKTEELYFSVNWTAPIAPASAINIKIELLLPGYYMFVTLQEPEQGINYSEGVLKVSTPAAAGFKLIKFRLGKILPTVLGSTIRVTLSQSGNILRYDALTINKA